MKAIEVSISDDKLTMYVIFPSDPPVRLKLDAEHADKLIKALMDERGEMLPTHPKDLPASDTKAFVVSDPGWVVHPDPLGGGTFLHLRDTRVGWMHYVLPPHEAESLGKTLVSHSGFPVLETTTAH